MKTSPKGTVAKSRPRVSWLEGDVGLSLTSTSPAPLRLAILMLALRAYERGEPEMAMAPVEAWLAPYRVVRL